MRKIVKNAAVFVAVASFLCAAMAPNALEAAGFTTLLLVKRQH